MRLDVIARLPTMDHAILPVPVRGAPEVVSRALPRLPAGARAGRTGSFDLVALAGCPGPHPEGVEPQPATNAIQEAA